MEGKGTPPCSSPRDSHGTWGPSWQLEDGSTGPVTCGLCSQPGVGMGPPWAHGRERHWTDPEPRSNRSISHALAQSTPSSTYRNVCGQHRSLHSRAGGGQGCWAEAGAALGVPETGPSCRAHPGPAAATAPGLSPAKPQVTPSSNPCKALSKGSQQDEGRKLSLHSSVIFKTCLQTLHFYFTYLGKITQFFIAQFKNNSTINAGPLFNHWLIYS